MSELDRAVDARIDAYRPQRVPPFDAIKARRARRKTVRATGAAVLSVVAIAGVAFGSSPVGGAPDRLPSYGGPAEPAGATYVLRYEQGYPYDAATDQAAVDSCTALPGVGEVSVEQSLPPNYVVTLKGRDEADAFARCAADLPGVAVTLLPSGEGQAAEAAVADALCAEAAAGWGGVVAAAFPATVEDVRAYMDDPHGADEDPSAPRPGAYDFPDGWDTLRPEDPAAACYLDGPVPKGPPPPIDGTVQPASDRRFVIAGDGVPSLMVSAGPRDNMPLTPLR